MTRSGGPASEAHRHEKAIDVRLSANAIVAVKDPVVAILARKRVACGNAIAIAVDLVIIVGDAVHLIRSKVMGVVRSAASGFDPARHDAPRWPRRHAPKRLSS